MAMPKARKNSLSIEESQIAVTSRRRSLTDANTFCCTTSFAMPTLVNFTGDRGTGQNLALSRPCKGQVNGETGG